MARVKTFMIHPIRGVPDRDVSEFLSECEEKEIIHVTTTYIPGFPENDIHPRMMVVVTKLDDFRQDLILSSLDEIRKIDE